MQKKSLVLYIPCGQLMWQQKDFFLKKMNITNRSGTDRYNQNED